MLLSKLGLVRSKKKDPSTEVVAKPGIVLDLKTQQDIAETFCPIFYLHSNEQFYPSSPQFYLKHCSLYRDNGTSLQLIKQSPLTSEFLYQYARDNSFLLTATPMQTPTSSSLLVKLDDSYQNCTRFGQKHDLPSVPIYCRVAMADESKIVLVYTCFFCRQGPYNVYSFKNVGEKDADIQYFMVQINRVSMSIEYAYFGHHGTQNGAWKSVAEITLQSKFNADGKAQPATHPAVYVSLNRHGLYHKAGVYIQNFGLENDHTARGGDIWQPKVQMLLPDDDKAFDPITMGWALTTIRWNDSRGEKCSSMTNSNYYRVYDPADSNSSNFQLVLPQRAYTVSVYTAQFIAVATFFILYDKLIYHRGLRFGDISYMLFSYMLLWMGDWVVNTLYDCNR